MSPSRPAPTSLSREGSREELGRARARVVERVERPPVDRTVPRAADEEEAALDQEEAPERERHRMRRATCEKARKGEPPDDEQALDDDRPRRSRPGEERAPRDAER